MSLENISLSKQGQGLQIPDTALLLCMCLCLHVCVRVSVVNGCNSQWCGEQLGEDKLFKGTVDLFYLCRCICFFYFFVNGKSISSKAAQYMLVLWLLGRINFYAAFSNCVCLHLYGSQIGSLFCSPHMQLVMLLLTSN